MPIRVFMVTPPPGCCDLIHAVCPGSFGYVLQVFVFIDNFYTATAGADALYCSGCNNKE
jgi:hypothetical protein